MAQEPARKRVLIVDDDMMVATSFRRLVLAAARRMGLVLAVEIYHDGASALEAARTDPPPDLILSDMHMQVLDGLGLLRGFREHSQAPFLLLSGKGLTDMEAEEVTQLQASFEAKPIDMEVLEPILIGALLPAPKPLGIIVADADEHVREELSRLIRDAFGDRVQVLSARDAREAYTLYTDYEVSALITGNQMGDTNGTELAIRLRLRKQVVPIVVRSTLAGTETLREAADIYTFDLHDKHAGTGQIIPWLKEKVPVLA